MSPEWSWPGDRIGPKSGRNASATIHSERGIDKRIDGLVEEHPRHQRDLEGAIAAALAAGAGGGKFYDEETAATYAKGDGSPVTDADLAADQAIRRVLTERFPDDAILSEE